LKRKRIDYINNVEIYREREKKKIIITLNEPMPARFFVSGNET